MALETTVIEQAHNFFREQRFLAIEFIFLCIAGTFFTIFSVVFDFCVDSWKLQVSVSPFSSLVYVIIACIFVELFDPNMRGSGIPEMKVALSKNMNPRTEAILNLRGFIVKGLGLLLVLCSGLPFGREGPFVHMASMFFYLLFNFLIKVFVCTWGCIVGSFTPPSFSPSMLSSACALGVACTFASPIGGVLFSIEVTTKHFRVRNYWKCCMVAVLGAIIFKLFGRETDLSKITNETPVHLINMKRTYLSAVIIGVFGAGMALLFTALFKLFHKALLYLPSAIDSLLFRMHRACPWILFVRDSETKTRRPLLFRIFHKDASAFGLINSVVRGLILTSINLLIYKFVANEGTDNLAMYLNSSSFDNSTLFLFPPYFGLKEQLGGLLVTKLIVAVLLIMLPVPCGIFKPLMFLGALFGRFYAATSDDPVVPASLMGVLGAASVVGAVTQSVSAAIIVVDLTNQEQWLILALVSAFVSNLIYKLLRPWNVLSIYDTMAAIRGMSYLPDEMDEKYPSFCAVRVESLAEEAVDLEVSLPSDPSGRSRVEPCLEMSASQLTSSRVTSSGHYFFRLTAGGECLGLLYRSDIPASLLQSRGGTARHKAWYCCGGTNSDLEAQEDPSRPLLLVPHGSERQRKQSNSRTSATAPQHWLLYTPLCHVTCWVPPYWNLLEAHQLMHERRYHQVLVSGQPTAHPVITYERLLQKIDDLHKEQPFTVSRDQELLSEDTVKLLDDP